MYTCICATCGKVTQVNTVNQIRKTCGGLCLEQYNRVKGGHRPIFTRPANRDLHPDGVNYLIEGIVKQASQDVLRYSPANEIRQDAERFFRSEYFTAMTDMDGAEVLRKLHCIYNMRREKRSAKA